MSDVVCLFHWIRVNATGIPFGVVQKTIIKAPSLGRAEERLNARSLPDRTRIVYVEVFEDFIV